MADDQDLDSFFAKKDKKGKSKKKKGKISNQQLAKELEGEKDTEKKDKKKKEKPEPSITVGEENTEETPNDKEEEWGDFEPEKEADLTDLKIRKLEISESGNDDDDYQGSGEERQEGSDENNPWKVAQQQQQQQPEREPSPEPEPEEKPEPPPAPAAPQAKPTNYVPPHLRNQTQSPAAPSTSSLKPRILGRGGRSKKAPDITNQDSFPSLECAAQESLPSSVGAWGRKSESGFESVRHGSRTSAETQEPRGPKLNLGNMYSALQDS